MLEVGEAPMPLAAARPDSLRRAPAQEERAGELLGHDRHRPIDAPRLLDAAEAEVRRHVDVAAIVERDRPAAVEAEVLGLGPNAAAIVVEEVEVVVRMRGVESIAGEREQERERVRNEEPVADAD